MNLQEFLDELKNALNGEIPQNEIYTNLRYYQDYVKQQEQKGKSEAEVLNQLGDPRLIARTIIDTFRLNRDPQRRYDSDSADRTGGFYDTSGSDSPQDFSDSGQNSNVFHIPVWLVKVIVVVVLLLIFSILFWLGGMAVKLFFKIGVPLILLYLIYSIVRNFFSKK